MKITVMKGSFKYIFEEDMHNNNETYNISFKINFNRAKMHNLKLVNSSITLSKWL